MECFAAPHFSDASLESGNNKMQLCPMCIFLFSFKAAAAKESTLSCQGCASALCLFCISCCTGVI